MFKIRFCTIRGTELWSYRVYRLSTTIFTANGIIKEQLLLKPFFPVTLTASQNRKKMSKVGPFKFSFCFSRNFLLFMEEICSIRDLEGLDSICV